MLIVCSRCTTGYDVRPQALGAAGRKVRCTRCGAEWIALPSAIPLPPGRIEARPEAASLVPGTQTGEADDSAPPDAVRPPGEGRQAGIAALVAETSDNRVAGEAASSALPAVSSPRLSSFSIARDGEKHHDIESAAARQTPRNGRRTARLQIPLIPTLIAVELLALLALLVWRAEVVRIAPSTAAVFRALGLPVNLRNLVFSGVHAEREDEGGATIFVVEGTIENHTAAQVAVPRLRFALRNDSAAELLSWTMPPDQSRLGPGEALRFRSRVASPPADGSEILVRFVTRRDFVEQGR